MRHALTLAIALAFTSAGAFAAAPPPSSAATANTPAAQLHALFDKAWAEAEAGRVYIRCAIA